MSYRGKELKKPLKVDKLKYLVVGTGRCGTVYMAKLLTSLGLPCGHESIFQNDTYEDALRRLNNAAQLSVSLISKLASNEDEKKGISWFGDTEELPALVADSSYMVAPFLDRPELADVKIIHVIREPMQVINSFVEGFKYFHKEIAKKEDGPYHKFIYHHVPELLTQADPVSRAALYYVRWNEMIENKSRKENYFLHRIEASTSKLIKFLGCTDKCGYDNKQANHKDQLKERYTFVEQIKEHAVRDLLVKMKNRYYKTLL